MNANNTHAKVPLSNILKGIAFATALCAVASLGLWLSGQPFALNPFVAIMCLTASPFVYLMGRAASR